MVSFSVRRAQWQHGAGDIFHAVIRPGELRDATAFIATNNSLYQRPMEALNTFRSRLCRDEVQPVRGGQIKGIADECRGRIERRIHLDLRQQLLSPSGTKDGHGAFFVPNVKPVAGQQEASPNGPVRLVFPDVGARCRVQTMNRSAHVPNVQVTVLLDGRSHHATDLARSPEEPAPGDVSLAVRTDRMNQ